MEKQTFLIEYMDIDGRRKRNIRRYWMNVFANNIYHNKLYQM